jgi:hypothetical protein
MSALTPLEFVFVGMAFLFQAALLVHFALRKWRFSSYIWQYGWIFYTLSLPAALVSVVLLRGGLAWSFWLGGFIFLAWAAYGYVVEYRLGLQWRKPVRWQVFGPYVLLYLATEMFYWWPLALLFKPLWYAQALLFTASTVLNVLSHTGPQPAGGNE